MSSTCNQDVNGPAEWKLFSLTCVAYKEGDTLSELLAISSLIPLAIVVSYCTLIVFRRDLCTIFALIGQLANEVLNLVLKNIVKDKRPLNAGYPQMFHGKYAWPSNHCQFICFFAAFITLLFLVRLRRNGNQTVKYWRILYAVCCWLMAAVVCFGRYYLGQHTASQVLSGVIIGIFSGSAWFFVLNFLLTPYFPFIVSRPISEWLLVRDTTLIPNIIFYEYTCARAEGRARSRKISNIRPKNN